jgi:hypothetical protein
LSPESVDVASPMRIATKMRSETVKKNVPRTQRS